MEELTIEQKAKRYDEALKRARNTIEVNQIIPDIVECVESLFPELKESEDEKIRKHLISYFKSQIEARRDDSQEVLCTYNKWIAWLEKQSQTFTKKDVDDAYLKGICDAKQELEKQCEQKPVSKVKPKFRIGDVIEVKPMRCQGKIFTGKANKIIDITEESYIFDDGKAYSIELQDGWKLSEQKPAWCEEDERIRKALIDGFTVMKESKNCSKTFSNHNIPVVDILAWLEKQGDTPKEATYTYEVETGNGNIKALVTEEVQLPKFKDGDWVVDKNGTVQQILSYKNGIYKHTNGYSSKMFEDAWRLWDITKDVKDGDVLCSGQIIVIFKHFEDPSYRQHIVAYIGLDTSGNVQITDGTWNLGIDKAKPATKEQHDTLVRAMADAGWKFDFEKKELKRIESDLTEFENVLADVCRGWIGEELGWKDYIIKNSLPLLELAKKQFDEYEQKPVWSKEDKYNHNIILALLNNECVGCADKRIAIEWFKSITPQSQWKPNKEQLDALREALAHVPDEYDVPSLTELYEQLKQL